MSKKGKPTAVYDRHVFIGKDVEIRDELLRQLAIYIPTYGRTSVGQQRTLQRLPRDLKRRTTLVVAASERDFFMELAKTPEFLGVSVAVQPKRITEIHTKRQYIAEHARDNGHRKFVMLDDDLDFQARGLGDESILVGNATEARVLAAFARLSSLLDVYAHGGISCRQGNNRHEQDVVYATRNMYVLGYRTSVLFPGNNALRPMRPRFDRVHGKEDFDMTLQLLRAGHPNFLITDFCVGQAYGKPGGCSNERTVLSSNAAAEKLAALHPGLVSVVDKVYTSSVPRKEVIVHWKRALAQSGASLPLFN